MVNRVTVHNMYRPKVIPLYFANHLGAISNSTHFLSTYKVTNYVSIKLVKPKRTVGNVNGAANNKLEVDMNAKVAGINE